MSVLLVMEGVVVPVTTQLVATTVHVPQDTLWLQIVTVVLVSHLNFCMNQSSYNGTILTKVFFCLLYYMILHRYQ